MSDLATLLDTIQTSQASKEVTANAAADAESLASVFGRRASTCAALSWGYYGGRVNGTLYANGAVTATASNTNYVVVHRTTYAVSIATTNTNWNNTATYGRAYLLTAGASTITNYEDHRFSNDGTGIFNLGGAGGTIPTGTGFVHITSGAQDGTAVAVDLSSAHATGILAAARFPALTGDVTTSSGAVATTLANTAVTPTTYGDSTHVAQITVDSKGRITAASNVVVTPGSGGDYALISKVTTSGSQATVTFSSIPGSYTHLKVLACGRDTSAAADDINLSLLFNGDTTAANYTDTQNVGSKAGSAFSSVTVASTAGCVIGFIPGTLTVASAFGIVEVFIPLYAGTTFHKGAFGTSGQKYGSTVGAIAAVSRFFAWNSTAAITSITFTAGGTAFLNGSVFSLYGLN